MREDLERYFVIYGHQIYNLDFVAPTLVEEPLPVLIGLKALEFEPGQDALQRQVSIVQERNRLTMETAERLDPIRRAIFRTLARWARGFAPHREEAHFFVGAGWPMLRRFARELGARLTEAGMRSMPEDIYYLTSDELATVFTARQSGHSLQHLAHLAQERQELREARKRLHPPPAVPPTARCRWESSISPIGRRSGATTQRRRHCSALRSAQGG